MKYVVLPILLGFVIFCVVMAVKTSKVKKVNKKKLKELKVNGCTQLVAPHTYGLPVAEGVFCTIQAYADHIDFLSGTTSISLSTDKITDMCIKTESEIQQQYVSSVGGAVGGAVLFGPIGAMIGGRAKKKTSKTLSFYLIITYLKDGADLSYLGFDVTGCSGTARKLVSTFQQNNTKSTHIEL